MARHLWLPGEEPGSLAEGGNCSGIRAGGSGCSQLHGAGTGHTRAADLSAQCLLQLPGDQQRGWQQKDCNLGAWMKVCE